MAQATATAQPAPRVVTVGVYRSPPFVMEADGRPTGMAIELWELAAAALGLQSRYVWLETNTALVDALAAAKIDVGVTNLAITRERAERIDFTHPWFDSGLRVMVHNNRRAGFSNLIDGLRDSGHLRAYAVIAGLILCATVLLTLFDRRYDAHFPRSWREGIAESFYAVMSVATSGTTPSRRNLFGWVGRLWQGLWLACGVAVLAYVTSSVTSVMTTMSLTRQIHSVGDLSGHRVGVRAGSIAETYARNAGFDAHPFPNIEQASVALAEGQIDAIIGDAPVLEYHAHTHRGQRLSVVGPIFQPDKYAFALQRGSSLTRPLTIELIGAHESGRLEELRRHYFGNSR
ncbi:transporter substrate-binding domain-containing protein [Sandaracinobacter neustonicus]|uniref:Transporter substrate-binding domain-containing protein n=2 Tax=Sandaracinobacter neustonicus TaxID=1715348 RepID=A0A501XU66_9SPHN|nr:transporter substrate-binding domain-containing protein [Sandaracinobacter neustonicus]